MSADYQHLDLKKENQLLQAFWVKSPSFGFHWHYHPELEITCVKHGRGIRMVGDNVSAFEAGDFVFLGANLPHTWISDDDFNKSSENMEVAVLQFHPAFLSNAMLNLPEMKHIKRLLKYANRGIRISPERGRYAADLLYQLIEVQGFQRLSIFFTLLNFLGETHPFQQLASKSYIPPLNDTTEERILNVCRYVHDHFMHSMRLETIAQIAHMNQTAFCRFFKKTTGQTIFEYINDLRIGKACNLLLEKRKMSISTVAYQSGFNSQTLFNRTFLKKKGMTPSQFRKMLS